MQKVTDYIKIGLGDLYRWSRVELKHGFINVFNRRATVVFIGRQDVWN